MDEDLKLLATTVSYFSCMKAKVSSLEKVVTRLERVAEAFLLLAQRHAARHSSATATEQSTPDSPGIKSPGTSSWPGNHDTSPPLLRSPEPGLVASTLAQASSEILDHNGVFPTVHPILDGSTTTGLDPGVLSMHPFLNWLPMDVSATRVPGIGATSSEPMAIDSDLGMESSIPNDGLFTSTFDWLSWDAAWNDPETLV